MDERFTTLLAEHLPLLGAEMPTEDTVLRDAGLDSMGAVELLFGIEERLDVALLDDDLNDETFATAGSLWRTVRSAMAAEPAEPA